jgi:sialic acid synthase SpsE
MQTVIIAEIGTSHQGSLSHAKELIHAAKESGATCAKFQLVFADEIIHPNAGYVPLPGGSVRLYDKFKELEQGEEFYHTLKNETEKAGIDFLCTPFGLKSLSILREMQCQAYKIASPELNHLPLIDAAAALEKPLFLSLGVSLLSDIERALFTVNNRARVTLLHCVTSYPAPETDYNLRQLPHLASFFGVDAGVSDHSMDPRLVPALAVFMGARAVEKHICLSRKADGLDDPIALEPRQFAQMTESIRAMESDRDAALTGLNNFYGREKIEAVLGSGKKELADSEKANYGRTNRSVCAVSPIKKGDILTAANTALYRCEKELRIGLPPFLWPQVIGRAAAHDIDAGEGIRFEDLGGLHEDRG